MRHTTERVNGIDLHVRAMGEPAAPLVLFLHGFPEYSGAWDEVLPAFAGSFHAVAPDQRGYARSSKPEGVEAYRIKHLVRDILALGERLLARPAVRVVAHDWGASVGYATAIAAPSRIARLVGHQRRASGALPARAGRGRGAAPGQHLHALSARSARRRSAYPPTASRSYWAC